MISEIIGITSMPLFKFFSFKDALHRPTACASPMYPLSKDLFRALELFFLYKKCYLWFFFDSILPQSMKPEFKGKYEKRLFYNIL